MLHTNLPISSYATRTGKIMYATNTRSTKQYKSKGGAWLIYATINSFAYNFFATRTAAAAWGALVVLRCSVLFFFALGRILFICCCIVSFCFCFVVFCLSHHFRKGHIASFLVTIVFIDFFFYSSTSSTPSVRADPSSWRDTSSVVTKLRYRQVSCTRQTVVV